MMTKPYAIELRERISTASTIHADVIQHWAINHPSHSRLKWQTNTKRPSTFSG